MITKGIPITIQVLKIQFLAHLVQAGIKKGHISFNPSSLAKGYDSGPPSLHPNDSDWLAMTTI
jgi:hypothetical protein